MTEKNSGTIKPEICFKVRNIYAQNDLLNYLFYLKGLIKLDGILGNFN